MGYIVSTSTIDKKIDIPNYLISNEFVALSNPCGVVCVQCTISCTICMGCVSCTSGTDCGACQGNCTSSCTSSCTSGCTSSCTYCTSGTAPVFPDDVFEWEIPKVKGNEFRFTTSEYRNYVSILNKKLIYFGKQVVTKSTVYDKETVYAYTINSVLDGLRRCGATSVPEDVSPKEDVTAAFLNRMRDCLNGIKDN